jgi:hypothetical protein
MTNEQIEYIIEIIKTIGEEWHKWKKIRI